MIPGSKSNSEYNLDKGSIVLYEHNGSPLLGIIQAVSKSKFIILNQRLREVQLAANRLRKIPGNFSGDQSTVSTELKKLEAENLERLQSETIEEIWKFVAAEEREYKISELCELYFGDNQTSNHLALAYALLRDKVFFKRTKDLFRPRTEATIEELKKAEQAKQQQKDFEAKFISQLEAKLADNSCELDSELEPLITLLIKTAANSYELNNSQQKEVTGLLSEIYQKLSLEQTGPKPDQAFRILKQAGILTAMSNPALIRHELPTIFDKTLLTEAASLSKTAIENDSISRLDLTEIECITIDDSSTLDMDDALSLEKTATGYLLGIHISDVASVIKRGSALDLEAMQRGTSVYIPEGSINMFPEDISHGICSLFEGEKRLCISCLCELSENFEISSSEIKPTIIKVSKKYSYTEVDQLLETDSGLLFNLYNAALAAETRRFEAGGSKIPKLIAVPKVDSSGGIELMTIDENGPSRSLIGEMMILANTIFAEYAIKHSLPVLYRSQPPPEDDSAIDSSIPDGPAYLYAVKSRLRRSQMGFEPELHHTLGVEAYLQATSPIRRYLDLVMQRQFVSQLTTGKACYSKQEIEEIQVSLNASLPKAYAATKDSLRFWTLRWLEQEKRKGTTLKATTLRTDLKNPMVELDELFIPWIIKTRDKLKPGDEINLKITALDAWSDYLRFEVV